VRRVTDRYHRGAGGHVAAAVEQGDVLARQGAQRVRRADWQVAVRVLGVEELREHAIGNRRGEIAELDQAVETELAHALDVSRLESRRAHHRRQQRQRPRRVRRERRDLEQGRVRADLGLEVRADPAERLVHLQRVQVPAAVVQQVAGERGESGTVRGVVRRSDRQQHEAGDEGDLVMFDRRDAQPAGQRAPAYLGKREPHRGAGHGQPRAIDAHHDTRDGCEPSRASAVLPRGTTLSTTR
jgi:hypothetical protein